MLAVPRPVPSFGCRLTTVPGGVAVMSGGSPRRIMKAGWVALARLGSDPGWPALVFADQAKWLDFEREQVTYPGPGVFADRVRYHFEPGVVASLYVNEVAALIVPNYSKAPADRNPLVVGRLVNQNVGGGTADLETWNYTVPVNRILEVTSVVNQLARTTVAGALVNVAAYISAGGVYFSSNNLTSNVVGAIFPATGSPAGLVFPAGTVVSGRYANNDTGGSVQVTLGFSGTLFDA